MSAGQLHADPKRPVPDYDGRGNPDSKPHRGTRQWIPRILLFPVYVVNEYVVRRPLGAFVTHAERARWANSVESAFTFGPKETFVVYPTAFFDFGLLPSVGAHFVADNLGYPGNRLDIGVATWGKPWLKASVVDRYNIDKHHEIRTRFLAKRSQDNVFYGIGPATDPDLRARYGLDRVEGAERYRRFIGNGESRVSVEVGVRRLAYINDTCCGDPRLTDRINAGEMMAPPGFGETYATVFGSADVMLDSRDPRPAPGSGAFLHLYGQPNADMEHSRSWIRYGGVLGGAADLTGHQRVLKMQLAVGLIDELQGESIPFTEYPILDDDLMPGFVTGTMIGKSFAAAQLGYTWPVMIRFDGQTRFSVGNAFDHHLDGLRPGNLRFSWDIGLTTDSTRDHGFELLFGLGTEIIDQGTHISSVRVTFGSREGF